MASALEMFRAQREAVEDVDARLREVAALLGALRQELSQLAQDPTLRRLLQEEETWLIRAQDLVAKVARFREAEVSRFWPGVWRRWAAALLLASVTATAAGAGYVWVAHPYELELADLRDGVKLGDAVARRVLEMTPDERRQFEVLMKWREASPR